MTLEEAMQQRWDADNGLAGLVPIERVFTSFVPADTERPYVVVERRKSKPMLRGSSGLRCVAVELVFVVEAASYDAATAIAAAIGEVFESADFDAGEGRVVAMRRGDETRQAGSHESGSRETGSRETVRWELHYDITLCHS